MALFRSSLAVAAAAQPARMYPYTKRSPDNGDVKTLGSPSGTAGRRRCNGTIADGCAVGSRLSVFGSGSVVSGNVASAPDGVALANLGTALLGRGARVGGNAAAAEAFNNANLTYVLPTAPGTYFEGVFACAMRNCTTYDVAAMHDLAGGKVDGLNVVAAGQAPCPLQSCDYARFDAPTCRTEPCPEAEREARAGKLPRA